MKNVVLEQDIKKYFDALPKNVENIAQAQLLQRCKQQIKMLEDISEQMATMLDLFHTCIATEKMPVLNSECDETILILLRNVGHKPACNIAGEKAA